LSLDQLVSVVSLAASIVSLVLAVVAIWLSWLFFRASVEASRQTEEASRGILSGVERLEKLFDSLYSGTFTMMQETVTDLRKHAWNRIQDSDSEAKIEAEADQRITKLRDELSVEIHQIAGRVGQTDSRIDELANQIDRLLDRAIAETRNVESEVREKVNSATLRNMILAAIGQRMLVDSPRSDGTPVAALHELLSHNYNVSKADVDTAIEQLQQEGYIARSKGGRLLYPTARGES